MNLFKLPLMKSEIYSGSSKKDEIAKILTELNLKIGIELPNLLHLISKRKSSPLILFDYKKKKAERTASNILSVQKASEEACLQLGRYKVLHSFIMLEVISDIICSSPLFPERTSF